MQTPRTLRISPALPNDAGYVDFHGFSNSAGGWIFCGWAARRWPDTLPSDAVTAYFEHGQLCAETLVSWHERPDLAGRGVGLVLLIGATGRALGEFAALEVRLADGMLRLVAARPVLHLPEAALVGRARSLLHKGEGGQHARLATLLAREVYEGVDTLDKLPAPVHLAVDEALLVPPDGLLLIGWLLDPTRAVARIRLRSGPGASDPLHQRWVPVTRPDIVATFAPRYGPIEPHAGFVAYVPACVSDPASLHLEVELADQSIGYATVPRPQRRGLAALQRVLDCIDLPPEELEPAFDKVLGPSLLGINRARLAAPRPVASLSFGAVPDAPVCSVVIPLHGRVDFLLYQLAMLSEQGIDRHELLYVLDDPPRKRELLELAHSAHARFGVPFRLLLLEENLGFAPANNAGLAQARGEFVCFLNSDVLPVAAGWLDCLVDSLRGDPGLGVVGARLLFEDGTLQHDGLAFEPQPRLAGWPFPKHPGKGLHPPAAAGLRPVPAVTGACMLLRRAQAVELGGFDEDFVIGDFEDSDLCLRLQARGLGSAVDSRVVLYHLERQSQASAAQRWRGNASLLNAWTHTRRWFRGGARPAAAAAPPRRPAIGP